MYNMGDLKICSKSVTLGVKFQILTREHQNFRTKYWLKNRIKDNALNWCFNHYFIIFFYNSIRYFKLDYKQHRYAYL